MHFARVELSSEKYGDEVLFISDNEEHQTFDRKPCVVFMKTELAKAIMSAAVDRKDFFDCNGIRYCLKSYKPWRPEAKLNPFRIPKVDFTSYEEEDAILYVYRTRYTCMGCYNKYGFESVESRNAVVNAYSKLTGNSQKIVMSVFFCNHCRQYYINDETLKSYLKGRFLIDVKTERRAIDGCPEPRICYFEEDTVLSRNGYRSNVPTSQRRSMLTWLIDSGESTKQEIDGLLNMYLRRFRRFEVSVWKSDINFIKNYEKEENKTVTVRSVERR